MKTGVFLVFSLILLGGGSMVAQTGEPGLRFVKDRLAKVQTKPTAQDKLPACSAIDPSHSSLEKIYDVGHGVSAPKVIRSVEASYSNKARQERIQGAILIHAVVQADGMPSHLCLTKSLGYGLDEQAALAVRQYRFQPAIREGEPVPVAIVIEVNFRLY